MGAHLSAGTAKLVHTVQKVLTVRVDVWVLATKTVGSQSLYGLYSALVLKNFIARGRLYLVHRLFPNSSTRKVEWPTLEVVPEESGTAIYFLNGSNGWRLAGETG